MIKTVLFDTFGTIVDWRSSIAFEGAMLANAYGIANFDGDGFARAWRAGYRPFLWHFLQARKLCKMVDFVSIKGTFITFHKTRSAQRLAKFHNHAPRC